MISVRLITYEDMLRKLKPYGCRRVAVLQRGLELWETGWGAAFTMKAENDGRYDDFQYRRALSDVIARTMPQDWNSDPD